MEQSQPTGEPTRPPAEPSSEPRRVRIGPGEIVLDGLMAGVIGSSAIALFFLVVDFARFEPLFTPSLLGSAILAGAEPGPSVPVDLGMVASYTALHGAVFVALGIAGAWALVRRGTSPGVVLVAAPLFGVLEFGSILAASLFVPQVIWVLGPVTITVGNALAALAMGTYLHGWQPHPGDAELREAWRH